MNMTHPNMFEYNYWHQNGIHPKTPIFRVIICIELLQYIKGFLVHQSYFWYVEAKSKKYFCELSLSVHYQ